MEEASEKKTRRYWVHPVLTERLSSSLIVNLYPDLRLYEDDVFNYYRMSVAFFI